MVPKASDVDSNLGQSRKFAVHLGPSQNDLIQAVKATIDQLEWSELALLSHRETGKLVSKCCFHTLFKGLFGIRLRHLLDILIKRQICNILNIDTMREFQKCFEV